MMSESIQVPEGYKNTEVGIIPEEWEVEELGNVCNFYDHLRVPIKKADRMKRCGSYPYYGAQSIIDWIDGYLFDGNYLLIAEDGENLKSKVLPIAYQVSGKFWVNNHAHIIKPKDNNKIGYLEYILNFVDMEKYITGSAQPKLNQNTAKKIKIQLPFPEEQQKIASILSKVDEQIERTEQIIEKTEILKIGLMQKLLTKGIGHTKFKNTELGKIPEEWEVIKLGDEKYFQIIGGGTPSRNNPEYWINGFINWATPTDITKNKGYFLNSTKEKINETGLKNSSAKIIPKGSVLLTSRATIGALAINNVDLATNQGFANFVLTESVCNYYLLMTLEFNKQKIESLGGQSTFKEVSKKALKDFKILVPPLPEQQKIASILSKVDSQIQDNQSYLTRLQELKKGLMQDLLTGKVRVCA